MTGHNRLTFMTIQSTITNKKTRTSAQVKKNHFYKNRTKNEKVKDHKT